MTLLIDLYEKYGQSPWLDNLKRDWIQSGELQKWIDKGVRGLTSNPSIFEKAITNSNAYDEEFASLINNGISIEDAYWQLVQTDISEALKLLKPVYDSSNGLDGYVSVEVDPRLARDSEATVDAARYLDNQLDSDNLFIKIPGTKEGLSAIQEMTSEGRSINVTLLFSIERYEKVIDSYMTGLENRDGDLTQISSVASFFISRTETEIDSRLDEIGSDDARKLKGKSAVAQGQLAYKLFLEKFGSERWKALESRGATLQRPLWASTSTKNPDYPDTLYVDQLIGPNTVNTLPDGTLSAFIDHGNLARTIDASFSMASEVLSAVEAEGVDLNDVAQKLEREGVQSFENSFENLLHTLGAKAESLKT